MRQPQSPSAGCAMKLVVSAETPVAIRIDKADTADMQRADKAAAIRRGVLDQERGGALELTAGRKALQQAREQQQQRRGDADGGVGRRQRDDQAAGAHQQARSATACAGGHSGPPAATARSSRPAA